MSPTFIFKHLFSHWRANLIVFLGLLLTGALLAGLPAYARSTASQGLEQRLADAPIAARNILVGGRGLNDDLFEQIQATLGPLLRERVETRTIEVGGTPTIYSSDGEQSFDEFLALVPWSFSNLAEVVTVVDGRLPEPSTELGVIEAVIGPSTANDVNFSTASADGQTVTLRNLQLGDELVTNDGETRFRIVGIVTPTDPQSDTWWGSLVPFSFAREARNGASMPETIVLSLLVRPEAMVETFTGHTHQWRLLTDTSTVSLDNAAAVQSSIRDIETRLVNNFLQVDSSLVEIIAAYQAELDVAQVSLFLLAFQAFVFSLLVLVLLGSFLNSATRAETVALSRRGYSRWQLTGLFAAETALMAVAAAILAPLAAYGILLLWAGLADQNVAGGLSSNAWLLGSAGVLLGWLTLVFMRHVAVGSQSKEMVSAYTAPAKRPLWQRAFLDLILVVGGAVLYWQGASGNLGLLSGQQSIAGSADPLLLLGPTMLLLGGALLFLRLFPPVVRFFANRFGRGEALATPYELAHLGRDPVDPGRAVLVISVALGLILFSVLSQSSLAARQLEMAHYVAGADVRVGLPNAASEDAYAQLSALDGVAAASPVYVNARTRWAPELARLVTLLAVEPDSLTGVAAFAPGISNLSLNDILPALAAPAPNALPAVFSFDSYPPDKQVGDIVTYVVGTEQVDFEVRGLISRFPAVDGPFILTNLAFLEERVDLAQLREPWVGQKELWIEAEGDAGEPIEAAIGAGEGAPGSFVSGTAAAVTRRLQTDLVGQQTMAAFRLNSWTVGLTSVLAFALIFFFVARRRLAEFNILATIGTSNRQLWQMVWLEGLVVVGLGLLAGTILGITLATMMRPLLSQTLTDAVGGDAIQSLVFDWTALLPMYGLLIAGYLLALLIARLTARPTSGLTSMQLSADQI